MVSSPDRRCEAMQCVFQRTGALRSMRAVHHPRCLQILGSPLVHFWLFCSLLMTSDSHICLSIKLPNLPPQPAFPPLRLLNQKLTYFLRHHPHSFSYPIIHSTMAFVAPVSTVFSSTSSASPVCEVSCIHYAYLSKIHTTSTNPPYIYPSAVCSSSSLSNINNSYLFFIYRAAPASPSSLV